VAHDHAGTPAFRRLLASVLLLEVLLAGLLVAQCWPAATKVGQPAGAAATPAALPMVRPLWLFTWTPDPDALFVVIVLLAGTIGASIHALTSLATFYGNGTFAARWTWWYLFRAPIGMSIALIFYLLLRGGFLSADASTKVINPYAMAALAGLSGMFSKQATDKLEEVFATLFRTAAGGDQERQDKATGPALHVDRVDPDSVPVGTTGVRLTVSGRGFGPAVTAQVGSAPRRVERVGGTELRVTLDDGDTAAPGRLRLIVGMADGPGPERTSGLDLRVRPRIDTLAVTTDDDGRWLDISGAGFDPAAQVTVDGQPREVRRRGDTMLRVAVTDQDATERHRRRLVVSNPYAAGGASDPVTLATAAGWP